MFFEALFLKGYIVPNLIFAIIYSIFLGENIKKHPKIHYILYSLISISVIGIFINLYINGYHTENINPFLMHLFNSVKRGALGYAFFIIVMFLGVLDKKNKIIRRLAYIRKDLAIIGSIVSFCHLFIYGISYLLTIFFKNTEVDLGYTILFFSSLSLLLVLIVLFISSFDKIKNKIKAKNWKALHKWSYYFYFMLFSNVIFVFLRRIIFNNDKLIADPLKAMETYQSLVLYSALLIIYSYLRFKKRSKRVS